MPPFWLVAVQYKTGRQLLLIFDASFMDSHMRFEDSYFSREQRYSLGREIDSGKFYLSIPVSNRLVDYEEYYEITEAQADAFVRNPELAVEFADQCRNRLMDDRLLVQPGTDRGVES
jgi:hypothetical protein